MRLGEQVHRFFADAGNDSTASLSKRGAAAGNARDTLDHEDAKAALKRLAVHLNNAYYCRQQLYSLLGALQSLDAVDLKAVFVRPTEPVDPRDLAEDPSEVAAQRAGDSDDEAVPAARSTDGSQPASGTSTVVRGQSGRAGADLLAGV